MRSLGFVMRSARRASGRAVAGLAAVALVAAALHVTAPAARAMVPGIVTLDAWTTADTSTADGNVDADSTLQWTHLVDPDGLNRALIVAVAIHATNGILPEILSITTTAGGPALNMTRVPLGFGNSTDNLKRVEIWELAAPPVGTNTITVTFVDDADDPPVALAPANATAASYSFTAVDQADPSTSATTGNNNGSASALAGLTTAGPNGYVVDVLAVGPAINATPSQGQENVYNIPTTEGDGDDVRGVGGTYPDPGFFQVVGYNLSASTPWVLGAIALQPALVSSVGLVSFDAERYADPDRASERGVLLRWRTGQEAGNLGFHVYREGFDGERVRVTSGLVAGSALRHKSALLSGYSYAWFDAEGTESDTYWLEDVGTDGRRTVHGPFAAVLRHEKAPAFSASPVLGPAGPRDTARGASSSRPFVAELAADRLPDPLAGGARDGKPKGNGGAGGGQKPPTGAALQFELASRATVKLSVREAGWYRVTGAELAAAGFNTAGVDPRTVRLFADGVEQAIRVVGEQDGRFDATDAVEFFGSGVDVATTDTRVYWLAAGAGPGKRAKLHPAPSSGGASPDFPATVELDERLVYFAGLANGDKENFFGEVVFSEPLDRALALRNLAPSANSAQLEVALQGVTEVTHHVSLRLNGQPVGDVLFEGKGYATSRVTVPHALLVEGDNVVTLASSGPDDVALVDYIRITYSHAAAADLGELFMTVGGRLPGLTISGFASPNVRVVDVTTPSAVAELGGSVTAGPGGFSVTVQPQSLATRKLYAFSEDRVRRPDAIEVNRPSSLHAATNAADVLVVAHGALAAEAAALGALRQSQGYRVVVADVADVFDEFGYGYHTPLAVKAFVRHAATAWRVKPRFLVLLGDASYDPRDYFGAGSQDLVPTKLVDTAEIEAASDDWLADFDGDDVPELAVGRLPARTAAEARTLVEKVAAYERTARPNPTALLVADAADGANFELYSEQIRERLPASYAVEQVSRAALGDAASRERTLAALGAGAGVVHYAGHGSVDVWRGNLLNSADAAALSNGGRLSLVTISNCLNGYFHDPLLESLGEALVRAPSGGAVAVWASSGITTTGGQQLLGLEFYRHLFSGQNLTIGEAARRAKAAVGGDHRRTWVLVGDPVTRLK